MSLSIPLLFMLPCLYWRRRPGCDVCCSVCLSLILLPLYLRNGRNWARGRQTTPSFFPLSSTTSGMLSFYAYAGRNTNTSSPRTKPLSNNLPCFGNLSNNGLWTQAESYPLTVFRRLPPSSLYLLFITRFEAFSVAG